jgi:hypothetical protein
MFVWRMMWFSLKLTVMVVGLLFGIFLLALFLLTWWIKPV